ncbi:MAG TPA: hypothetical protein H9935_10480 [Candidatus Blautia merdigallinarum]|uniref:Uncharacterized protein n=1 Tax=Candidatus Blautia merdigallinarum TaxID=2838495 RepID=A0A9D2N5F6_9FIRM|nr:hypothetical protein [Candidatus Blautia merdigallinarum]
MKNEKLIIVHGRGMVYSDSRTRPAAQDSVKNVTKLKEGYFLKEGRRI